MNFWKALKEKIIPNRKPEWAALCKLAYTDKSGRRYYQYADELNMNCVYRKGEIEKCMMELRYGSDYSKVIDEMKASVNGFDKQGNMRPDMVKTGYLIQELIDRKDILLLPEILFKICANTLIREDENPYLVDEEVLEEKIATFKSEIQTGGLHAFFQSVDLLKLIGLSNISIIDFNRLMTASAQRQKQFQAMLNLFTSEQQSQAGFSSEQSTSLRKETLKR